MKTCPTCSKEFGSDGSYRVHKHRFHRVSELQKPRTLETNKTKDDAGDKNKDNSVFPSTKWEDDSAEISKDSHENIETKEEVDNKTKDNWSSSYVKWEDDNSGKSKDDGLSILFGLGTVAIIVIIALFGKKQ